MERTCMLPVGLVVLGLVVTALAQDYVCPAGCENKRSDKYCLRRYKESTSERCQRDNAFVRCACFCRRCIVDGSWGTWQPWGDCTDCLRERTRGCDRPAPENGGAECPGNNTQVEECDIHKCLTTLTTTVSTTAFTSTTTAETTTVTPSTTTEGTTWPDTTTPCYEDLTSTTTVQTTVLTSTTVETTAGTTTFTTSTTIYTSTTTRETTVFTSTTTAETTVYTTTTARTTAVTSTTTAMTTAFTSTTTARTTAITSSTTAFTSTTTFKSSSTTPETTSFSSTTAAKTTSFTSTTTEEAMPVTSTTTEETTATFGSTTTQKSTSPSLATTEKTTAGASSSAPMSTSRASPTATSSTPYQSSTPLIGEPTCKDKLDAYLACVATECIPMSTTTKYYGYIHNSLTVLVRDVYTDEKLASVTVKVSDTVDSTEIMTNSNGIARATEIFPLYEGTALDVELKKTGYYDLNDKFTLGDFDRVRSYFLTPILTTEQSARAVMSWEDVPRDMDLHVIAANPSTGSLFCHVFYNDKTCAPDGSILLELDRDNTQGGQNGPETVTWSDIYPNMAFLIYVHAFTDDALISASKAKLEIYGRDGLTDEIYMPQTGVPDSMRYWIAGCFFQTSSTDEFVPLGLVSQNPPSPSMCF